jgi:Lar family restriction alleviation protein
MSQELKPCPFCGSTNLNVTHESSYVMCYGCDADGPVTRPSAAAIAAWNNRAAPVPPAGEEIGALIDHLDDYIARINGDDRGADATVNELRAHVTRLQAENAALQQRLNVADQRVDDLEAELTKAKRGYEWESQRAAALLEELQEYEGSSGSLQPSLKENHGIPGTSFQRLNQLANEGE